MYIILTAVVYLTLSFVVALAVSPLVTPDPRQRHLVRLKPQRTNRIIRQ